MPDGPGKTAGIALGEQAARLLLAQREGDGTFGTTDTYRPFTMRAYVPTDLPVVNNVSLRKPFSIGTVSRFRPRAAAGTGQRAVGTRLNETREWGAFGSVRRTAWQTETARFWQYLGTPAWNQVARSLATGHPLPLADDARLFALLNIAMFDAYLAVFDANTITISGVR